MSTTAGLTSQKAVAAPTVDRRWRLRRPPVSRKRTSRDEPLSVDGLLHLHRELFGGALGVDVGDRSQRRRDAGGHRLIHGGRRAHGSIGQLLADDLVLRILRLKLRIVVQRGTYRGQPALDGGVALVLDVAHATDRLEGLRLVLAVLADREVQPADRDARVLSRLHARVVGKAEHLLALVVRGLELRVVWREGT